jgi:acid phosphatase
MKIKGLITLFVFLFASEITAQNNFFLTSQGDVFDYYNSGGYDTELNAILDEVIPYIDNIQVEKGKTAIVFDLDETLLSNEKFYYEIYKGLTVHNDSTEAAWIMSSGPTALPTKRLYDYVLGRGFTIFIITGSSASAQPYIENNLKNNGYTGYTQLICKPQQFEDTTALAYKSYYRKQLTEQGYNIVANVGDQYSDMGGGYSGMFIRLPNYLYYIE